MIYYNQKQNTVQSHGYFPMRLFLCSERKSALFRSCHKHDPSQAWVQISSDPEGVPKSLRLLILDSGVGCHAEKPENKRGIDSVRALSQSNSNYSLLSVYLRNNLRHYNQQIKAIPHNSMCTSCRLIYSPYCPKISTHTSVCELIICPIWRKMYLDNPHTWIMRYCLEFEVNNVNHHRTHDTSNSGPFNAYVCKNSR